MAAGQAVHLEHAAIRKQRVLEEYRRIAFLDPRGFWEKVGFVAVPGGPVVTIVRLRAITDLDAEHAAALDGFEAVIKNAVTGDGATGVAGKSQRFARRPTARMLTNADLSRARWPAGSPSPVRGRGRRMLTNVDISAAVAPEAVPARLREILWSRERSATSSATHACRGM